MTALRSSYVRPDEMCMRLTPIIAAPAKECLLDLEKHMPHASLSLVYDFAKFLAGYIGERVDPAGFAGAYERAIDDVARGKTSERDIPVELCGYSHHIYEALRTYVSLIAKVIFSDDFARGVHAIVEATKEARSSKRKERPPLQYELDLKVY